VSTLSTPVRIVLLLSLCLNLLLAAGLGGLWWRVRMPPERRALVRAALAPDRAGFVADLRALRAAHAGVREALRAQPFESNALAAALAEVRERERAMAERVHGGLLRLSAELTDAERAQLADSVPRRDYRRWREGREGREGKEHEHDNRHRPQDD